MSVQVELFFKDIIKLKDYWLCAGIYTTARLANNLSMAILPFYLIFCLHVDGVKNGSDARTRTPWQLAVIPFIMYLGSNIAAMFTSQLSKVLPKKIVYGIGTFAITITLIFYFFLTPDIY